PGWCRPTPCNESARPGSRNPRTGPGPPPHTYGTLETGTSLSSPMARDITARFYICTITRRHLIACRTISARAFREPAQPVAVARDEPVARGPDHRTSRVIQRPDEPAPPPKPQSL